MTSTQIFCPTRIHFGRGSFDRLPREVAGMGGRVLVVTGRNFMSRQGLLGRVVDGLGNEGANVSVFDGVSPNPKSSEVDLGIDLARRDMCDVIVGIGGGSAMDAAKAIGACGHLDSCREAIGGMIDADTRTIPVVAVPTTTGSGAEVTRGAIITDSESSVKDGIRGDPVCPAVAIVDPDLTDSLPAHIAAETSFDVLSHAIEGYVAKRSNPMSDLWAERIVEIVSRDAIPSAFDSEAGGARERMCWAALLGGFVVANASTCLPHRIQQAMTGSVSHGRGLAAVYGSWLEATYDFCPERFDRLARIAGWTSIEGGVRKLSRRLYLPTTLGAAGFGRADIDLCLASVRGNLDNDPSPDPDRDRISLILENAASFTGTSPTRSKERSCDPL